MKGGYLEVAALFAILDYKSVEVFKQVCIIDKNANVTSEQFSSAPKGLAAKAGRHLHWEKVLHVVENPGHVGVPFTCIC